MVEGYVQKVCDKMFKNQIDKEKIIAKFLQKFKSIQRTCALLKDIK